MGLLFPNKLSTLQIDADKDWATKGITNIKQLAAAMAKGDLIVRGDTVLVRLQPGSIGLVLTSAGPLHIPTWSPGGGVLNRYLPVPIDLYNAEAVVPIDHTIAKGGHLNTTLITEYLDAPASNIKRIDPTIALTDAESVLAAADQNISKTGAFARAWSVQQLIDGAVADDGGVLTDETAAAKSGAANDMTLLPAAPAVGDAYMLGSFYKANKFPLNIGTAGAGNWTLVMKYWNGAWVNCVDEVETTAQFQSSGLKYWQHTPQVDWATSIISGLNLYWVRIEVTNFVNIVTQPKGTQAWWELFL